jgi:hypothetical protein
MKRCPEAVHEERSEREQFAVSRVTREIRAPAVLSFVLWRSDPLSSNSDADHAEAAEAAKLLSE